MSYSGFDYKSQDGFHPDTIKLETAYLKADIEKNKIKMEFREKILLNIVSPQFLVFIVTLMVLISGFLFIYKFTEYDKVIEYWKIILPLITTYVGYAIGRRFKE